MLQFVKSMACAKEMSISNPKIIDFLDKGILAKKCVTSKHIQEEIQRRINEKFKKMFQTRITHDLSEMNAITSDVDKSQESESGIR